MGVVPVLLFVLFLLRGASCLLGLHCGDYSDPLCGKWMHCNYANNTCVCDNGYRPDERLGGCLEIPGFCDGEMFCWLSHQHCNYDISRCECYSGYSFKSPSKRDFCVDDSNAGDVAYISIIVPIIIIVASVVVITAIRWRIYRRIQNSAAVRTQQGNAIYVVDAVYQRPQQTNTNLNGSQGDLRMIPQVSFDQQNHGNADQPPAYASLYSK